MEKTFITQIISIFEKSNLVILQKFDADLYIYIFRPWLRYVMVSY